MSQHTSASVALGSSTNFKIIGSALFGDFHRYKMTVAYDRFGDLCFYVTDAERLNECGEPETVRIESRIQDALAGLPNTEGEQLRKSPRKGDLVIVFGVAAKVIGNYDPERGYLVKDLDLGEKWYASLDLMYVIR